MLTASPVTTKVPGCGSVEDHVGRIVGHDSAALSRGTGDGVRGAEHHTACRSGSRAESWGSRGASAPPCQPRRDTRSVATGGRLAPDQYRVRSQLPKGTDGGSEHIRALNCASPIQEPGGSTSVETPPSLSASPKRGQSPAQHRTVMVAERATAAERMGRGR